MRVQEPLSSHLPVLPEPAGRGAPTPTPDHSPAAGQGTPPPALPGRRPAGDPPLAATLRFEEAARQVVITLLRADTGEVVCQIPPEKILRLIAYFRELALTLDDRA